MGLLDAVRLGASPRLGSGWYSKCRGDASARAPMLRTWSSRLPPRSVFGQPCDVHSVLGCPPGSRLRPKPRRRPRSLDPGRGSNYNRRRVLRHARRHVTDRANGGNAHRADAGDAASFRSRYVATGATAPRPGLTRRTGFEAPITATEFRLFPKALCTVGAGGSQKGSRRVVPEAIPAGDLRERARIRRQQRV